MIVEPRKLAPSLITSSRILLVEGKDEFLFFEELLKYHQFDKQFDMQAREVGGKDKFRTEFPAFLNDPGFYQVTGYAIIRDADRSARSALESVQRLLKKYNQPFPRGHAGCVSNDTLKVGIFIMPGNASQGMLEDLCLQAVHDHPVMPHVENFMTDLKNDNGVNYPKNESKAKVQAFLSGMPETVASVGLAAKKGFWPFNHVHFSALLSFLKELGS